MPQILLKNNTPSLKLWRTRKTTLITVLTVVIISIVASLFIFNKSQEGAEAADWFNEEWYYRQSTTITNSSGGDVTNQYVKVSLDTSTLITAGKLQSDCDDIRITDVAGNLLTHFINGDSAYTCNDTDTEIFVLVASLPANTSDIYIYYGNPSAENVEPVLGSSQFPGLTCKTIYDHGDSTTDGIHYVTLDGDTDNQTQVYCDMNTASGGWTLISQRGGGIGNIESCGANLNAFLHDTCGNISSLDYGDSYSIDIDNLTNYGEYLSYQFTADLIKDTDDAWIAYSSSTNVFPDSTGVLNTIAIDQICDINEANCDTTDTYFMYAGDGWWGNTYCNSGYSTGAYVGNYGYCQNGISTQYASNDLYGGRNGYNETKLWNYTPGAGDEYMERFFLREDNISNFSGFSVAAVSSEEQGPGPVGYWSFDEGYGTTAYDQSPNGNDGTITGTAWKTGSECVKGSCLFFDGTGDKITIADNTALQTGTTFSFSAWVRRTDFGESEGIMASKNGDWQINFHSDDTLRFIVLGGTSLYSTAKVTDTEWHHVAFSYSGTTATVYLDGIEVINNTAVTISNSSSVSNYIGTSNDGASWVFNGYIDEVKVYNYARSADQIKQDYNQGFATYFGSSEYTSLSDGLVGYWKMDETSWSGVAGEVVDSSGAGNHGTSTNAVATSTSKFGYAGEFDGVSSYVRIEDNTILDLSNYITLSAWIKPNSVSSNDYILSKQLSTRSYALGINSSGDLRFRLSSNGNDTGAGTLEVTASGLSVDVWQHVVATYNGQIASVYIDGVMIDSTDGVLTMNQTSDPFFIGSINSGTYYFDGEIDEARVYNRALSPEEVRHLYEWAPGPIMHWNLDEKNGVAVNNTSGVYSDSGSLSGTGNHWTNGKFGSAGQFNGSDDTLDVSDSTNFDNFSNGTFSLWIKPYSITAGSGIRSAIMSKNAGGSNNGDMICGLNQDLTYRCYIDDGIIGSVQLISTDIFDLNEWNYLTITWKSRSTDVYFSIYVNGILNATTTQTAGTIPFSVAAPLGIAATNFNGALDDIRMYNYTLTPRQILADMNAGKKNNPISYWSFDEGQGTTAYDYGVLKEITGTGNDGTLTNMSTSGTSTAWTTSGKSGGALRFDTDDSYINLTDADSLRSTSYSFSAWIKPQQLDTLSGSDRFTIYSKWTDSSGANIARDISIQSNGKIRTRHVASSVSSGNLDSNTILESDKWYYLTITYDADSGSYGLYINGELDNSLTTSNLPYVGNTTDASFGAFNFVWSAYHDEFIGLMDEVKLYNYAITLDEMRQNYNSGQQVVLSKSKEEVLNSSEGLVAWWKMDEASWSGASGEVLDSSGAGNTGTAQSTANTTSTAKYGRAGAFNGSSDYVLLDSAVDTGMNHSWTKQFWAKLDSSISGNVIYDSASGNYQAANMNGSNSTINITTYSGTAFLPSINYTVSNITDWNHYAVVYTMDYGIDLYVNGRKVAHSAQPLAGFSNPDNANYDIKYIGAQQTATNYFDGQLDDFKVYNYERTDDQIMMDYTEGPPAIGYWKMDTKSGSSAIDSSGRGSNGTITGATWGSSADCQLGACLKFDGSGDYMDAGALGDLKNNFSFSMWINPDAGNGASFPIAYQNGGDSTSMQFRIEYAQSGIDIAQFGMYINGATTELTASTALTPGVWQHLVCTYDGTTMKMYIDGVLDNSKAQTGIPVYSSSKLVLGARYTGSYGGEWAGKLDEVKVYDYALTDYQVAQEYNGGAPVGYWKLDKGEGGIAYDYSGNGMDGFVYPGTAGGNTATSTMWSNGASGKMNASMDFDGTDDKIEVANNDLLNITDELMVCSWVYADVGTGNHGIFEKTVGDLVNTSYLLFGSTSAYAFRVDMGGTQTVNSTKTLASLANTWVHVCGSYSKSNNGRLSIYINGIEDNYSNITASSIDTGSGSSYIGILGKSGGVNVYPFNGRIDEVKVWNYVLTPAELKKEYNGGFGTYFK